jgi:transcriptional regulator with XRE-family HTH domain
MFGQKVKELREAKGLVQRQVAAELEVDTAYVSKIESDEKLISKNHISKLSKILNVRETELQKLWLADKILKMVDGEDCKEEALKLVLKSLK